jgi:hypothetical protein
MQAVLSTEKAATIGGLLICLAAALTLRKAKSDFANLRLMLSKARSAWRRSLSIDEENVRATDTACWIIRNVLEQCPVPEDMKYELLAEWNELVVHYEDLDLNPEQLNTLDKRQFEFARALDDRKKLESIVARSTEKGNYAVRALIARGMLETDGPQAAIDYLRTHCREQIISERPILLLYYRLWWQVNSGLKGYFQDDEVVVHFSKDAWEELYSLANGRLSLEGEKDNQLALFHAAWASMQLDRSKTAEELLRRLDTISVGNFRRGRTLVLLSNFDGTPREFTGETRSGPYSHKGKVWIESLRLELPYLTAQFPEASNAGVITGFHVALNYRGAFVQPASIYNNKRAKRLHQTGG